MSRDARLARPAHPGEESPTRGAAALGVAYDVDGLLRIAAPSRQLSRLQALVARSPRDRRSLLGMSHLLRALAGSAPDAPVFYLTALPECLAGRVAGLLRRDGYPSGEVLPCGRALVSGWLVGAGLSRKRAALARLAERHPDVRWVLVGDDAGHDPTLFAGFARRRPGLVAAVALRQVLQRADAAEESLTVPDIAVVRAPNGEEMLPRLQASLGLEQQPRQAAVDDWFLTAHERGNDATRLRAWTTGNAVRPLVHGCTYLASVADALATTAAGDSVLFAGWRADSDELLTDDGPTVVEALTGAARRGALVRGLLWRSHLEMFGYQVKQNRTFAGDVNAAGGQVLLDQRVRASGCHHQKLVVIRHAGPPATTSRSSAASTCATAAATTPPTTATRSRSRSTTSTTAPPWHDMQVEMRGPAVRDVEDAFRERGTTPLRSPGCPGTLPDRIRRRPRRARCRRRRRTRRRRARCAVQVLRTYPHRRPRYPFAPAGERSVARAYAKALGRAAGWSTSRTSTCGRATSRRAFADALRRAPRLHLIAVVPRYPGPGRPLTGAADGSGSGEALAHRAARRAATASRSSTSRTATGGRSTSTPRSASSTTSGRASAATTSTAARGPTTPS